MRTLLIAALALAAAPAAAQTFDPLASHRAGIEQMRVQTELQGLSASLGTLQTQQARQQLRATVARPAVALTPQPDYVAGSSPRCDPRTTSAEHPCVVKPTPPAGK